MLWKGGRKSDNVEDQRSSGMGRGVAGRRHRHYRDRGSRYVIWCRSGRVVESVWRPHHRQPPARLARHPHKTNSLNSSRSFSPTQKIRGEYYSSRWAAYIVSRS